MNYRMVLRLIGQVELVEAAVLIIPLILSICYGDSAVVGFLVTIAALLVCGIPLVKVLKIKSKAIYAKEGLIIAALSWLVLSLFGALPFFISGWMPNYADAFFETVSGFTTTGSTVLTNIEALPKSLLFWRSLTHWIGGMGILVFAMAILPQAGVQSMHIMRAEVPGPSVGKLVSKTRLSARILYGIYFAMTVIETVFLLFGGMNLFDAITAAFSTAGTGGFANFSASIAYYDSAYIDIVITVFMLLFSINFNLYFMMLSGQFIRAIKSEELRWFFAIVMSSMVAIAVNIMPLYNGSFFTSLRYSSFQVASVISTTGYATADFNLWPSFSKLILIILMFVGACAGSTGGGLKIARVLILVKSGYRAILRSINPKLVKTVNLEGKAVESSMVRGNAYYFIVYMMLTLISIVLLSFDGFDGTTTATAVFACINNVGPGLRVVGPYGGFSEFSVFGKLLLSFVMLAGRLEIYPVLVMLVPGAWKKR